MKASTVVECYRTARRSARRMDFDFKLDEERLERSGFSQEQIDSIFVLNFLCISPWVKYFNLAAKILKFGNNVDYP